MEIDGMPVVLGGFSGFINLDWLNLKNISDFFAGMGDVISAGLGLPLGYTFIPISTGDIRNWLGWNDVVDPSSTAYSIGQVGGYAWGFSSGGMLAKNLIIRPTTVMSLAHSLGFNQAQIGRIKPIIEIFHNWFARNTMGSLKDPGHIQKVIHHIQGLEKSIKYLSNMLKDPYLSKKTTWAQKGFLKILLKLAERCLIKGKSWLPK
jgi:hypothetical protein